jgi:hypothetical protein
MTLNNSQDCENLGAAAYDLWLQFQPEDHALAPVLCVVDSCICIILSICVGRNPGLLGPVTLQAMGFPIHENALRRSLPRCLLHRFIVAIFYVAWRNLCFLYPPPPRLRA